MICVSIANKIFEDCRYALKDLDFAELRLDTMDFSEYAVKKIFSMPLKLIATCRSGTKNDKQRQGLLLAAIDAGAAYVDVELEADENYRSKLIETAKQKHCKVIISYHNFEKTPNKVELKHIMQDCFDAGADIAKIACQVNCDQDNARLLSLLDSDEKLVVIGMGEKGKITRIVAPLLGSEFTFAALSKGQETASGQITKQELEEIYKRLDFNG